MATILDIINFIRAEGSQEYQERVPEATRTNIASVGNPILTYSPIQNEFSNALVNKIVMQMVHNKVANNPLAPLKKGSMPLGVTIEEIHTNPATAETYDPTGSTLLTRHLPDVKTLYHTRDRQDVYTVTISKPQLAAAFTSWNKLEELINSMANSLYSGDNLDEFVLMKRLCAEAVKDDHIRLSTVTAVTDTASALAFVKAVKKACSMMTFPGTSFNKFGDIKRAADPTWAGNDVVTWTPREDQVLLIRADILDEMDTEVLAAAFNMDKVQFLAQTVPVDNFGNATQVLAILADKSFFQVYNTFQELNEFINPKGLYSNYFWHHHQVYSYSLFANAVGFVIADDNIEAFDAIADINGGAVGAVVYANAAAVIAALPSFVYADGGKIKVPVTTWVETDTYNVAAAGSYTFTATLGTLPDGVTNTDAEVASVEVVIASGE